MVAFASSTGSSRAFELGRLCFGLALLGLGVEHILRGRLLPGLPPLPPFLANSYSLAMGMGLFLIIAGTLLMANAILRTAALTTGVVLLASGCLHMLHPHAALLEVAPHNIL